jgi:hypothetical protein
VLSRFLVHRTRKSEEEEQYRLFIRPSQEQQLLQQLEGSFHKFPGREGETPLHKETEGKN